MDDLAAVYYFKGREREGRKGRGEKGGRRGIAPEKKFLALPLQITEEIIICQLDVCYSLKGTEYLVTK